MPVFLASLSFSAAVFGLSTASLPTCCRMSPALQALLVGRAARLDRGDQRALDRVVRASAPGAPRRRAAPATRRRTAARPSCRPSVGLSPLALTTLASSFWSPILALTVMSLPSRHTPSLTDVPGFIAEIMRVRSRMRRDVLAVDALDHVTRLDAGRQRRAVRRRPAPPGRPSRCRATCSWRAPRSPAGSARPAGRARPGR